MHPFQRGCQIGSGHLDVPIFGFRFFCRFSVFFSDSGDRLSVFFVGFFGGLGFFFSFFSDFLRFFLRLFSDFFSQIFWPDFFEINKIEVQVLGIW